MSEKLNTVITVIGIDIGKNSFHVVGLDKRGANHGGEENHRSGMCEAEKRPAETK